VIGRHTHPRPEAGYLKESLCCWSTVNRPSRWRPVRVIRSLSGATHHAKRGAGSGKILRTSCVQRRAAGNSSSTNLRYGR